MSITKQQLKSIVKECLVEILAEGMGPSSRPSLSEIHSKPAIKQKVSMPLPKRGNNVKYSNEMAETIKRQAGGDSVLASILADTAAITLPNMLMNEGNKQPLPPAGSIEGQVAIKTPEELFGDEAASKWAQLAFMGNAKKF
jgi:hypothetical protein